MFWPCPFRSATRPAPLHFCARQPFPRPGATIGRLCLMAPPPNSAPRSWPPPPPHDVRSVGPATRRKKEANKWRARTRVCAPTSGRGSESYRRRRRRRPLGRTRAKKRPPPRAGRHTRLLINRCTSCSTSCPSRRRQCKSGRRGTCARPSRQLTCRGGGARLLSGQRPPVGEVAAMAATVAAPRQR